MPTETRQSDYKRRFEEAISLRDSGRLEEAESLLLALIEERSGRPEALLILGGIQLHQERYSDSLDSFATLVEQQPASELASLGLFHSLWGLDRREEAFAEMRRYLNSHQSWEYRRLRRDLKAEGIVVPC